MNYQSLTNRTVIDDVDSAQIDDIECDNLVVNDSVSLPNLVIPSAWIISLNGDKINNPLLIDQILEKTLDTGVTIEGTKFKDGQIVDYLEVDGDIQSNGTMICATLWTDNLYAESGINVETRLEIESLWLKDSNQSHYYKILPSDLSANSELTLPNIGNDTFLFANAAQTVDNKTLLDSTVFANYTNPLKRVQFDLTTITSPYLRTVVMPDASGTMVLDSATQTLTNKTLVGATFTGATLTDSTLFTNVIDSTKKATFSCGSISTGTTRTVTLPDANGEMVLDSNMQDLWHKTMKSCTIVDSTAFASGADPLKTMVFYLGGITSGVTRIVTLPNTDGTMVLDSATQTLTNKSISADQIGTGTVSNTEFGYLDGLNQSLSSTSSPTFNVLNTYGHIKMKDVSGIYTYSLKPYYLADDVDITIPGATGDDYFVLADVSQTVSNKTLSSCGKITVTDTTDSTGITTNASIKTSGGLSVAKDIWATSFYGRYRNQYCCQLTLHSSFTISTPSVYTRITTLASGNTNGFNNGASSSMDAGGGVLTLPIAGMYRITARCYVNSGGPCTMVLGKNGSVYDQAYSIKPTGEQCFLQWIDLMNAGDTFSLYCAVTSSGSVGNTGSYQGIYLLGELVA